MWYTSTHVGKTPIHKIKIIFKKKKLREVAKQTKPAALLVINICNTCHGRNVCGPSEQQPHAGSCRGKRVGN